MYCTIDAFNHDEHDGTSDVYYEMTLKEYRYIKPTSEIKMILQAYIVESQKHQKSKQ